MGAAAHLRTPPLFVPLHCLTDIVAQVRRETVNAAEAYCARHTTSLSYKYCRALLDGGCLAPRSRPTLFVVPLRILTNTLVLVLGEIVNSSQLYHFTRRATSRSRELCRTCRGGNGYLLTVAPLRVLTNIVSPSY